MKADYRTIVLSSLVWVIAAFTVGAEKPSPFAAPKPEQSAGPPPAAPVSPVRPGVRLKTMPAPGTPAAPAVANPIAKPAAAATPDPQPPFVERVKQTEPIVVEVEDKPPPFQEVKPGMEKDAVMALLGRAATRIAMYEDSNFVEVLRYEWHGRWVGAVRLSNGKVIKVDTPR